MQPFGRESSTGGPVHAGHYGGLCGATDPRETLMPHPRLLIQTSLAITRPHATYKCPFPKVLSHSAIVSVLNS